jgi:hypothetical protein
MCLQMLIGRDVVAAITPHMMASPQAIAEWVQHLTVFAEAWSTRKNQTSTRESMSIFLRATGLAVAMTLGGCAVQGPARQVDALAPSSGRRRCRTTAARPISPLVARQADGLLVELIESAQAVSPSVASAASRIAQSRPSAWRPVRRWRRMSMRRPASIAPTSNRRCRWGPPRRRP